MEEEVIIVITDESGKTPLLVNEKCELCGRRKQLCPKKPWMGQPVACVCCDQHKSRCRHRGPRNFREQQQGKVPI